MELQQEKEPTPVPAWMWAFLIGLCLGVGATWYVADQQIARSERRWAEWIASGRAVHQECRDDVRDLSRTLEAVAAERDIAAHENKRLRQEVADMTDAINGLAGDRPLLEIVPVKPARRPAEAK